MIEIRSLVQSRPYLTSEINSPHRQVEGQFLTEHSILVSIPDCCALLDTALSLLFDRHSLIQ